MASETSSLLPEQQLRDDDVEEILETTLAAALEDDDDEVLCGRDEDSDDECCGSWWLYWSFGFVISLSFVTIYVLLPTLVGSIVLLYTLTYRIYTGTIHAIHISIALLLLTVLIVNYFNHVTTATIVSSSREVPVPQYRTVSIMLFSISILDVSLCWLVYPKMFAVFQSAFVDIDGTTIRGWETYHRCLLTIQVGMKLTIALRIILLFGYFFGVCFSCWKTTRKTQRPPVRTSHLTTSFITKWTHSFLDCTMKIIGTMILKPVSVWTEKTCHSSFFFKKRRLIQRTLLVLTVLSLVLLSRCIVSSVRYLSILQPSSSYWNTTSAHPYHDACCDDLDGTECALPFPSFHHMIVDPTSKTGWRMNLQGKNLPPMKGDIQMDLSFFNDLDGFSPMAPILFYLEGLKESQDAILHGMKTAVYPRLPYKFEDSITRRSTTLLWDVSARTLVPHTAREDYLDPAKPIILIIPSQPLKHGTHYAIAVINATGPDGTLLMPTSGIQNLFGKNETRTCSTDIGRVERYQHVLLPSLEIAAPWISFGHENGGGRQQRFPSLQLLFDFVTMSEDSLLNVKTVRDVTLDEISSSDYRHRVEITKIQNQNCNKYSRNNHNKSAPTSTTLVARTIHGSLQVPWWLENDRRDSMLSVTALTNRQSNGYGAAKFSIYVPCSLEAAAINSTVRPQKSLRAILEYGHGLFYNRAESSGYSLLRVAEDQGYLIMAMDWRGMSSFDMPVVIKSLLAQPNLFQATRDNLIQGYASKLVLQHFTQFGGLLEQDWLQFSSKSDDKKQQQQSRNMEKLHKIPTYNSDPPLSVFYGSSQGGILGAAYTALLGPTGLIERGVLGVPGTSFSLVLYKSNSFTLYDALLQQNFYNNRHIRIIVSILQLGWDPVEPSSILAPPLQEVYPSMLLQSGLGDPVIPTIATEALARAYNASILPNNPRKEVFEIKSVLSSNSVDSNCTTEQPYVAWTELLYEDEFQMMPINNMMNPLKKNKRPNLVHQCLRQDCALIGQMAVFINTGRVIDPCQKDRCLRQNVPCFLKGRRNTTKLSNWTCEYYDQCY